MYFKNFWDLIQDMFYVLLQDTDFSIFVFSETNILVLVAFWLQLIVMTLVYTEQHNCLSIFVIRSNYSGKRNLKTLFKHTLATY